MDVVPYLSAVILISTIATIVLAVLSYAAFKLRDRRKPKNGGDVPQFFHRFVLAEDADVSLEGATATGAAPGVGDAEA